MLSPWARQLRTVTIVEILLVQLTIAVSWNHAIGQALSSMLAEHMYSSYMITRTNLTPLTRHAYTFMKFASIYKKRKYLCKSQPADCCTVKDHRVTPAHQPFPQQIPSWIQCESQPLVLLYRSEPPLPCVLLTQLAKQILSSSASSAKYVHIRDNIGILHYHWANFNCVVKSLHFLDCWGFWILYFASIQQRTSIMYVKSATRKWIQNSWLPVL